VAFAGALAFSTRGPDAAHTPATCVDNTSFEDAKGYNCASWAGYDCSADGYPAEAWAYSAEEIASVQTACPDACELCTSGSRSYRAAPYGRIPPRTMSAPAAVLHVRHGARLSALLQLRAVETPRVSVNGPFGGGSWHGP